MRKKPVMDGDRSEPRPHIPRDVNDVSEAVIEARQQFVQEQTGVALDHVARYSFDAAVLPGNIEHFIGVAQVPIGIAGPLHIRGEHAQGDFLVPLATTEGTLVASYNRGMRLLSECGGVQDHGGGRLPCSGRRCSCLTTRSKRATSVTGWRTTSTRSRPLRRRPRTRATWSASVSTPWARFATSASTSPRATPPGRT